MSKIVRFYETGGPDVLKLEDYAPEAPGAGEVLLTIEAVGLNRGEAAFRGGHYVVQPTLPSLIGAESAGRIAQIGPDVEGWSVGDAVYTLPGGFPTGVYGVYATEAIVPAVALAACPEGLSAEQSASIFVAFLTAFGGLVDAGQISEGEHVVISAASSGVGLAALQIARDRGAIPIATTRTRQKADALVQAGAAHVIATDEQDVVAEILRITDGVGVRLIFDPIAGPFAETVAAALANEGTLMIYGGMANQPATFPRHLAIRKNLTMRGYNFSQLLANKERSAAARAYISERVADGRFSMPIAYRFGLDDVVEAHRQLEANQHVGKILLVP